MITYENAFPPINQALISQRQVKYVEDITFTRNTENLGVSRTDVIQTISDIGQVCSYVQSYNHLNLIYLGKATYKSEEKWSGN